MTQFQGSHPPPLISYPLFSDFLSLPHQVGFSSRKMFFLVLLWNVLEQKQGELRSRRIDFGHRQHARETGEGMRRAQEPSPPDTSLSGSRGWGNLAGASGARRAVERWLAGSSCSLFWTWRWEALRSSNEVCSSGPCEPVKSTLWFLPWGTAADCYPGDGPGHLKFRELPSDLMWIKVVKNYRILQRCELLIYHPACLINKEDAN